MCGGRPSVPAPVVIPQTPTEQDPAVQASLEAERRRQANALGRQSTLLTGGAGLTTPATTAQKTLLGQ